MRGRWRKDRRRKDQEPWAQNTVTGTVLEREGPELSRKLENPRENATSPQGHRSSDKQVPDEDPGPARLLLLLATTNADKGSAPAAVPHRLAMMCILANALREATSSAKDGYSSESHDHVIIDIGLTNSPLFTKKVSLVQESPAYRFDLPPKNPVGDEPYQDLVPETDYEPPQESARYEHYKAQVKEVEIESHRMSALIDYDVDLISPKQTHLVGFDTLTRVLDPKYYDQTEKLAPLSILLGGRHSVRAYRRPESVSSSSSSATSETQNEEDAFLARLASGQMEEIGAEKSWAERIEVAEVEQGQGVSSTRVRKLVEEGEDERWKGLVVPGVAEYIRRENLYRGDESISE